MAARPAVEAHVADVPCNPRAQADGAHERPPELEGEVQRALGVVLVGHGGAEVDQGVHALVAEIEPGEGAAVAAGELVELAHQRGDVGRVVEAEEDAHHVAELALGRPVFDLRDEEAGARLRHRQPRGAQPLARRRGADLPEDVAGDVGGLGLAGRGAGRRCRAAPRRTWPAARPARRTRPPGRGNNSSEQSDAGRTMPQSTRPQERPTRIEKGKLPKRVS